VLFRSVKHSLVRTCSPIWPDKRWNVSKQYINFVFIAWSRDTKSAVSACIWNTCYTKQNLACEMPDVPTRGMVYQEGVWLRAFWAIYNKLLIVSFRNLLTSFNFIFYCFWICSYAYPMFGPPKPPLSHSSLLKKNLSDCYIHTNQWHTCRKKKDISWLLFVLLEL
jgi:hypothetical protein